MTLMTNKEYCEYVAGREKRSPCLRNSVFAFLSGGLICVIGKALFQRSGFRGDRGAQRRYGHGCRR